MHLMLGIPILDMVSWPFFLYTSTLIGKLAKKYDLSLSFVNRAAIDRARDIIVTDALDRKCDRLLFIDDDTIIPFDTVERLEKVFEEHDDAVAASGFCYQRGYKYLPMVYRYEDLVWGRGHSAQLIEPFPKETFQVNCTGMGVCLLRVEHLAKIKDKNPPCFGRDGGGTEDFYFFKKAYDAGFTSWVDPTIEASHLGPQIWINSKNVDALRTADHKVLYLKDEVGGRASKGMFQI